MCGIAGILQRDANPTGLTEALGRMQAALRHRGPDDTGAFISKDCQAGLAHTRLAILDLSPAGHQPMSSPDGRFHITFNGEIYNFAELRAELEKAGEVFKSHSDTEVILRSYARYGTECIREFEGMYAFAIWDSKERNCFLARDPLGIKPLYYAHHRGTLAFASEIRALLASGIIPRRLSASALQGYLLYGSVQEPDTLVEGIHCLPAGHSLTWREGEIKIRRYWDLHFMTERVEWSAAVASARDALEDSVRRHFVSDVPVSIFLSGGIDSTALVALAKRVGVKDLRTFCISFDDPKLNEGDVARQTARHFGADHHDWRLDAATGKTLLKEFLARLDQPSIDGFNTFCVAKHAHDHGSKVVLSGLGGDELFGSYPSFRSVPRLAAWGRWASLTGPGRRMLGRLLQRSGPQPRYRRLGSFLTGSPSMARAYWTMRGIFTPQEARAVSSLYLNGSLPAAESHTSQENNLEAESHEAPPATAQSTPEDEVSYLEISRYMRNQLLRDSDVMSMAWGLELRVPFVDRKLVETLARIPSSARLAPGKRLLLEAVPEIPDWIANRPKRGFSFPFENWIADEWQDVFSRIDATSPVRLQSWYRRWCLFTLENFLQTNRIEASNSGA
jgi:asparagine synthase (glutamine-hydrolysing)